MKLVFFAHPTFLGSQSMMRFTSYLSIGMQARKHEVQVWSPRAFFFKLPLPQFVKKWMGYIDQYILFKFWVLKEIKKCPSDTLFVFTDQALGPWIPWIGDRPHVIHCHDFLAQRSALGQIEENTTKWAGRQYQAYIRRGYQQGKNFVSVSKKTQADLHQFLLRPPSISEVVYNGLNQAFLPGDFGGARILLGLKTGIDLTDGYILHIGGNQWYKNRTGVIEIYNAFRLENESTLPLLLIGQHPSSNLLEAYRNSLYKNDIHFLDNIGDELLKVAYIGAALFIFPSLAEGFGWPIAEAMAAGCLVITTGEDPMKEVAGNAGFFIPRKPHNKDEIQLWACEAGRVIDAVVKLSVDERSEEVKRGIENSKRFDANTTLDKIEKIYQTIANNMH